MSIVWDAPLVAAVAAALSERLAPGPTRGGRRRRGARLRALLLDHEARSLLLWFREATLVFRLHPEAGAVLLLDAAEPLEGARRLSAEVEAVSAPPDDRVLLLDVRKVRGGRERVRIVVELMTNQWNAVVAEGDDRRIRHVLRERDAGDRRLAVGSAWEPPPPTGREGVEGGIDAGRWRTLLGDVEPSARRGALLSGVAWTSSLNADWVLGDAASPDSPAEGLPGGPDGAGTPGDPLEAARLRWRRLADVATGAAEPAAVLLGTGHGLQPYPLAMEGAGGPGIVGRRDGSPGGALDGALDGAPDGGRGGGPVAGGAPDPFTDLLDAFRVASVVEGDAGVAAAIPSAWIRALEKRVSGARGRVRGLERELESAPDPGAVRALGDLILARYGEVRRGAERVELEDFEGRRVEVELDPRLGPQDNAARYYDEAGRAERALERIPAMIDEARAEAERLGALLARAEAGEADADEVRVELPEPAEDGKPGRAPDEGPSLPYRKYRSSGGLEIRVGRGSKHNDDLTFHHSRPDDVWLHARHAAGAHVVLRWDGDGAPPARDLAEAAVLAALHSKARTSGSVPVDWTRRKYVRSPRKAPPGRVVVERAQTVFVEPDEALEKRLREE